MYQIRRLPAAMALARERFIEFKDILYSSPMTMPRDESKGQVSSLPYRRWNNLLSLAGLHHTRSQGDVNRGNVSVFPPLQEEGTQDENESIYSLPVTLIAFLCTEKPLLYYSIYYRFLR